MAIKRTVIEEGPTLADPEVVKTTKTVVNPDIHTLIVDAKEEVIDTGSTSTIKQSRVVHEPLIKTEHPQATYEKKKFILRSSEVIWTIAGIIVLLLGFRVALKAIGANPASGFVSLIYGITEPLALPFQGILRSNVGTSGSYFEWSTIIAAFVYILIAYILILIIGLIRPVTPEEVESSV